MIKQLLVIFFTYEYVLDLVISSLIGYISIVLILTVLPGPYFRSTTFGDEVGYVDLPCLIVSPRTASSILSWRCIRGSKNLSLQHSFCLMQSLFDYFFVEPLDKICRDHHILTPSRISIKFMMKSTILAPR